MEAKTQLDVAYLAFALVAILLLQQWWTQAQQTEVVPYSESVLLGQASLLQHCVRGVTGLDL